MSVWAWILLIAGLSLLAIASLALIVLHTHRRLPARQAAEGDPRDISAPIPMHVAKEQDLMTERELEEERYETDSRSPSASKGR
jgi:hypothetical protein